MRLYRFDTLAHWAVVWLMTLRVSFLDASLVVCYVYHNYSLSLDYVTLHKLYTLYDLFSIERIYAIALCISVYLLYLQCISYTPHTDTDSVISSSYALAYRMH